ncbi:MAG: histidinol-phosphatase HisJ family protein [Coriobacteriales bacterium]|jgi:histidinol-phosphatase (PHP family)|nr:histidinol-phosphatase HisJ family protein [Coriobacteriales bacterium]
MELVDTHTHTFYSGHGSGSVAEVVRSAVDKGLTTLALTEHLPMPEELDPTREFAMRPELFDSYLADVRAERAAHPELEVLLGIECDWRPGAADYILQRIEPFDIVLGSVHMFVYPDNSKWEFDYEPSIGGWQERSPEQVWREYVQLWCEMVSSKVPFTVMTHPDLPKKLGFFPTFDASELWVQMAEAAAAAGVLIEVNTSGLRKPAREVYPGPALLRAFCRAGVPATVSSDAHTPADVGRDIDKAYAALRAAGYRVATVPTLGGGRREICL